MLRLWIQEAMDFMLNSSSINDGLQGSHGSTHNMVGTKVYNDLLIRVNSLDHLKVRLNTLLFIWRVLIGDLPLGLALKSDVE